MPFTPPYKIILSSNNISNSENILEDKIIYYLNPKKGWKAISDGFYFKKTPKDKKITKLAHICNYSYFIKSFNAPGVIAEFDLTNITNIDQCTNCNVKLPKIFQALLNIHKMNI